MKAVCVGFACLMLAATGAAQNLVTNGSFNGGTTGWLVTSFGSYDSTRDATGSAGSGSVRANVPGRTGASVTGQCIAVAGGSRYEAGGKFLIPSGQAAPGYGLVYVQFYSGEGCETYLNVTIESSQATTAGSWTSVDTGFFTAPPGATALDFRAGVQNTGGATAGNFQANLDDLFLVPENASFSRWIPAVIHKDVASKNARWRSDAAILNGTGSTANLTITVHATAGPLSRTYSMAGSSQVLIPDVAGWLGVTADSGPLEVTSDQEFFLSGRTYNQVDATHTYGQDYEGEAPADLLGAQQSAWLPQLTENAYYRTNIGIANSGAATANVTLTLYDAAGTQVWQDTRDYAAGGFYQYQQPYLPLGGIASGYAKVTVSSGSGVVAYASVVDANTGDPTTITMKR